MSDIVLDLPFAETAVNDCGSAAELAELAHRVKVIGNHLEDGEFIDFYAKLKVKILGMAGLPSEYFDMLDRVIEGFAI